MGLSDILSGLASDMGIRALPDKLAFFDFDRTLVAHAYPPEFLTVQQDSYFMECVWGLTALKEKHANDRPLPCMQWYAKKLFDEGYGLYCLTHEIFNLRDALKQEQLRTFYPDVRMTYLTVDSPDHKTDMMRAVAAVENCHLSDVIFVDDRMETVYQAQAAGIDARHLSDIVVLYESEMGRHEQDRILRPAGKADPAEEGPVLITPDDVLSEENLAKTMEECRWLAKLNGREQTA